MHELRPHHEVASVLEESRHDSWCFGTRARDEIQHRRSIATQELSMLREFGVCNDVEVRDAIFMGAACAVCGGDG